MHGNYIQHLKSKKNNASNPNLNPFKSCEPQANPCLPVNLRLTIIRNSVLVIPSLHSHFTRFVCKSYNSVKSRTSSLLNANTHSAWLFFTIWHPGDVTSTQWEWASLLSTLLLPTPCSWLWQPWNGVHFQTQPKTSVFSTNLHSQQ